MLWPISRRKNKAAQRAVRRRHKRTILRLEGLEDRRLLAGLVNIDTLTNPGSLTIQGDSNVNSVILSSTGNTGEYAINRPAGDSTQFTLNAQTGFPTQVTTLPFSIPNITGIPGPGGINVDLAGGADTFTFNNSLVTGGGLSVVNGNLNIQNDGANDTNVVSNVTVTGAIEVVDGNESAAFIPALPARLATTPPQANAATSSNTTLTDVMVNGNVEVSQGGGNTLTITSADANAITAANPVSSLIQGNLFVQPSANIAGAGGFNTLSIANNTQIVGRTHIAHNGGGSATTITNSRLQGASIAGNNTSALSAVPPQAHPQFATSPGLVVNNDDTFGGFFGANPGGFDSVRIQGNTLIGELTPLPGGAAPFSQIVVGINNGPGGSSTSLGADPNPSGPGATVGPQARGAVSIANGADIFGTQDVLSMNVTNVFGPTFVYNGGGTSNTTITNSRLGSSTLLAPGTATGFGNPFVLINDAGDDILVINATDVPWGVFVNNDDAGGGATPTFRHRTAITGGTNSVTGGASSIGSLTSVVGAAGANLNAALAVAIPGLAANLPGLLTSGEALFVGGGGGNDVVNIGQNPPPPGTVGATPVNAPIPFGLQSQLNINLGAGGSNSVNIQGSFATPPVAQTVRQLLITGGANSDVITIQNVVITDVLIINLGTGIDTLNLLGSTRVPNTLLGATLMINGGPDAVNDTINVDPGVFTGNVFPIGIINFP